MARKDGEGRRGGGRRPRRHARRDDEVPPAVDQAPPVAVDDPTAETGDAPDDARAGAAGDDPRRRVDEPTPAAAFQVLLDHNPLGALIVDHDARVVLHNQHAERLLGTHHDDLVNGRFGHRITDSPYDISRRDDDGRTRTLTLASTPFPAFGDGARLVTITAAGDRSARPDEPEQFGSSTHDPLTGLPARELLLNHLYEAALRSPSLDDDRFAVAVVDLERFVRVNEEHSHDVGDRVLQVIAARLTSVVRPGDYVSRSGDDEFAVVLAAQPLSAHLGITDRILEILSQPIVVDGAEIYCTPVIGIAEHVDHDDEHLLLERAEAAMIASEAGTTCVAPRPSDRAGDPAAIGALATGAIDEGQVFLHYQPIYALTTNDLIALEALARCEHPDDGLVVPDDRTVIVTEDGTERSLGQWVITEVCEQIATWRADLPEYLVPTVHINISARQASSTSLRREIAEALARRDLEPSAVRFEITEDVLADRDPRVEALLRDLTDDGVELILDGFGTGVSSLTHLRRFPLAGLKVDRSFVTRLMTDESSAQFVLAAIDAGQALHLPVTAVGVEDAEQKAVLTRWGCDLAQGYLLARPVTAVEAPRFFERDPSSLRVRPRGPLLRSSGAFVLPTA